MKLKLDMDFLADKLIDGVFIFIGVYFAFYFNQYKQNSADKKELTFNIEQIMRDLPSEEPAQKVPSFKITQVKTPEGGCAINTPKLGSGPTYGLENLNLIKNRGLTQLLPDQLSVALLTTFYRQFYPNYEEHLNFFKNELDKRSLLISDGSCLSDNKIKAYEKEMAIHWTRLKYLDAVQLKIGHEAYKKLHSMGYEKPPKESYNFDFKLQISDDPIEEK